VAAKAKAETLGKSLTASNFAAKAKELTEDPSGKNNGGDLGWFSRGRMVPEFEKAAFENKVGSLVGPIKTSFGYHWVLVEGKKGEEKKSFEQVKTELAVMVLQKRKSLDLDKLMSDTKVSLTQLLKAGDSKAIDAAKTGMSLVHFPGTEVNQFDLTVGPHSLTAEEGKKLFGATSGEILDFSTPSAIFLVKVGKKLSEDVSGKIATQLKSETQSQSQLFARKLREELLKVLNESAKVVTNPTLL
jgi:parvulin-like peptidyl-prolyl isomerase